MRQVRHRPPLGLNARDVGVTRVCESVLMANFRAALLTIRAWVERGSSKPLRADIRRTKDVANGFEETVTVTSPEAGAAAVKLFLDDVVADDLRAKDADATPR